MRPFKLFWLFIACWRRCNTWRRTLELFRALRPMYYPGFTESIDAVLSQEDALELLVYTELLRLDTMRIFSLRDSLRHMCTFDTPPLSTPEYQILQIQDEFAQAGVGSTITEIIARTFRQLKKHPHYYPAEPITTYLYFRAFSLALKHLRGYDGRGFTSPFTPSNYQPKQ